MTNRLMELYEELREISEELLCYYDTDKVKSYAVYVWSKETPDDFGENLFDILSDKIVFYNKEHKIVEDAIPIIEKIQSKLKEIEKIYE